MKGRATAFAVAPATGVGRNDASHEDLGMTGSVKVE
jgi:hypothetical protein